LEQQPVDADGPRDEIGTLATAFNTMLGQLRAQVAHIRQSALREQERLEALVAARTEELNDRNADMRRVLDNVGQGFVSVDLGGIMSKERSRIVETWLGSAPVSGSFIEYLAKVAPQSADWIELCWQMLSDGDLPFELALDQLPKQTQVGERWLGLEYRPIFAAQDKLERVLVVISDTTAERQRARAECDEREVTRLFTRVIADRAGFVEFFAEAHSLVSRLAEGGSREQTKNDLHTLKGNTSIFGLDSVVALCHQLEDKLHEGALSKQDLVPLVSRWNELSTKIRALLGEHTDRIEIDDTEYRDILDAVERGTPRLDIRRMLLTWKLEPTEMRLSRIAAQALGLAKRLGKDPLEVRLESGGLRLRREEWSEFWSSVVHVVRNAVDHGLETPDERRSQGKPVPATIDLRTRLDAECFTIEISDNGRGVDWERVRNKALEQGLPTTTKVDLTNALLSSGFSTRDDVTELSGRGVGLSAACEACRKRGGRVEIESSRGQGTTIRFTWPAQVAIEPVVVDALPTSRSSAELTAVKQLSA
jgi:two-component system chemotaxis sensor kinase CheA